MAPAWRLAKSLVTLRDQINALYPNRSKSSDGTIGNAEHSARKSDHNPNTRGVVRALDITNDPLHGLVNRSVAQAILDSRDQRIAYIISDGMIASGRDGPSPWKWRNYTGANAHTKHFHVSVSPKAELYDDVSLWRLALNAAQITPPARVVDPDPMLRLGVSGDAVAHLQKILNRKIAAMLVEDGDFGRRTRDALIRLQTQNGLVPDAICGPYTWEVLKS